MDWYFLRDTSLSEKERWEAVREYLKMVILYGPLSGRGMIAGIAQIMGRSEPFIRDILNGDSTMGILFLHATAVASDFHPDVMVLLEPEKEQVVPEVIDMEREIGDGFISLSKLLEETRSALADQKMTREEATRILVHLNNHQKELDDIRSMIPALVAEGERG